MCLKWILGKYESIIMYLENHIVRIAIDFMYILLILVPLFIIFTFNQSSQSIDMIRTVGNAILTVSSIILATILAIMTIAMTSSTYSDLTPPNSTAPQSKTFPESLLYLAAIPIFGIILGLFSIFISYFNFDIAKVIFGLGMEVTIAEIFTLFVLFVNIKTIFPNLPNS